MIDYLKKKSIANRANDEILYEFVLNEIENNTVIKGLWGKALANSNGNHSNAESIYLQYRVQSIKDAFTSLEIAYHELTKPKLFQYISEKLFTDTTYDIKLVDHTTTKSVEDYSTSKDEEAIYDIVADELSKDIKKPGLWLKAVENSSGDDNKTLALYVKYRSQSIISEREKILEEQCQIEKLKEEEEKITIQKREREKERKKKLDLKEKKRKKIIDVIIYAATIGLLIAYVQHLNV